MLSFLYTLYGDLIQISLNSHKLNLVLYFNFESPPFSLQYSTCNLGLHHEDLRCRDGHVLTMTSE